VTVNSSTTGNNTEYLRMNITPPVCCRSSCSLGGESAAGKSWLRIPLAARSLFIGKTYFSGE